MKPSTIATSASSHSRVKTDSTVPPRTTRSAGSSPRATARRRASAGIGAPYPPSLARRNVAFAPAAGEPSGARGDQDEVRREAECQAEDDPPRDEALAAEASADVEQLDHDVEDRAGREREEGDRERLADPCLPDQRPEERRASADQPGQEQEPPARAVLAAGERADDAEAFGRVVETEADDQDEGEADLTRRRRLADRQALGEVVEPDPGRDHQRERLGRREDPRGSRLLEGDRSPDALRAGAPAPACDQLVEVHEAHEARHEARTEKGSQPGEARPTPAVVDRGGRQRRLDRLDAGGEHVPEEEEEDARRGRGQKRACSRRQGADPADR